MDLRFAGWEASVSPSGEGRYALTLEGRRLGARLIEWAEGLIAFEVEGRVIAATVELETDRVEVVLGGRRAVFPLEREGEEAGEGGIIPGGGPSAGAGLGPLRSELPGKVLEIRVTEGERVEAGQVLLIVEAMKMEHPLRAGLAARVGTIRAAAGAQIQPGEVLLDLLPPEEALSPDEGEGWSSA